MEHEKQEYRGAMREVESTLRRFDRRFYRRDSLKGAPTSELVTLWRDLRRVRRRFQEVLPQSPSMNHATQRRD